MIGDYVREKGHTASLKVAELSSTKLRTELSERMRDISEFEPIPLTEEILNKNFGKAENERYRWSNIAYILFVEEFSNGSWLVTLNFRGVGWPPYHVYVSVVHQLQQFFRMFLPEIKIEL